jgi:lipoprotein-anchoring transpeptidase ErfK/SrfK
VNGLDWVYSQTSGQMSHVDGNGNSTPVATGYSGNGEGLNNPDAEGFQNQGPIPQGEYEIGQQQDSKNTGPGVLPLIPNASNNMFNRSAFQIHGDNTAGNQSASNGCIVLPRNIRDLIANSGDNVLIVVQ